MPLRRASLGHLIWTKKSLCRYKNRCTGRTYLAGFSLIEILVATLILALVTAGMAYVFLAGRKHILHARARTQSAELGRLFLAPLQKDVRQDLWGSNCVGSGVGCPSTPANDVLLDGITYKPTTTAVSNVPGTSLKKVTITINWTEPAP